MNDPTCDLPDFVQFVENADEIIFVLTQEGLISYISPNCTRMLGYDPGEVIGVSAVEFIHPDDLPKNRESFLQTLTLGKNTRGIQFRIRHKNGTWRWNTESMSPIRDSRGVIVGTQGIIHDITEQVATQSALQAIIGSMVGTTGLSSLMKIAESVSSWLAADCVMVGEIQPDHETVSVLSMQLDGKEVTGFSYTLKGTPCENVTEKGYCHYPDDAINLFPHSKDLVELNIRAYIGTPLNDAEGRVIGVLCALFRRPFQSSQEIRDIMSIIAVKAGAEIERSQIERELQQNRYMLAKAMDLANLVNWEFDTSTGLFRFNDRFYELYRTSAGQEGGYLISPERYNQEFVHPDDRDAVARVFSTKMASNNPDYEFQMEHRIIRRDGELRNLIVRVGVVVDDEGKIAKIHGANQDITEQKRLEEAFRQANAKLNLLTSITRHDITNQLQVLKGFLSLMNDVPPGPEYQKYFQNVCDAASRISAMIEFTKEYEDIGVLAPAWQNCRNLVETAGKEAKLGNIVVKNELPPDAEVYADPLIYKVIFNLIDNAVRYGKTITTIRFSVKERDGDHILVCEDDGVGIPCDEKEKIFHRGYGKNTGLGLAISRQILDITGITLRETGEPGKGARFEIVVPKGMCRHP